MPKLKKPAKATVGKKTVAKKSAPKKTAPKAKVAAKKTTKKAPAHKVVAKKAAPQKTTRKVVAKKAASKKIGSKVLAKKATPTKVARKVSAQKAAPQKTTRKIVAKKTKKQPAQRQNRLMAAAQLLARTLKEATAEVTACTKMDQKLKTEKGRQTERRQSLGTDLSTAEAKAQSKPGKVATNQVARLQASLESTSAALAALDAQITANSLLLQTATHEQAIFTEALALLQSSEVAAKAPEALQQAPMQSPSKQRGRPAKNQSSTLNALESAIEATTERFAHTETESIAEAI